MQMNAPFLSCLRAFRKSVSDEFNSPSHPCKSPHPTAAQPSRSKPRNGVSTACAFGPPPRRHRPPSCSGASSLHLSDPSRPPSLRLPQAARLSPPRLSRSATCAHASLSLSLSAFGVSCHGLVTAPGPALSATLHVLSFFCRFPWICNDT
jgi:hypothetical protein